MRTITLKNNKNTNDFLAAFDNVNHSLLIQQLETSFAISGSYLEWISSYLSNRSSVVSISNFYSTHSFFPFGVLQGSVHGPLLFNLHTSKIARYFIILSSD